MNNQTAKSGARVILAEQAYMQYLVDVPAGVTFGDLMKPEFWCRNADGRIRPRDRIRVRPDTEGFDLVLTVTGVIPNAGLIMRCYDVENHPSMPMGKRLRELEAQVRAEEDAKRRAEMEAIIADGKAELETTQGDRP